MAQIAYQAGRLLVADGKNRVEVFLSAEDRSNLLAQLQRGFCLNRYRRNAMMYNLTPRQIDVMRHWLAGDTHKEIAGKLGITPKTALKHIELAYRQLGVGDREAAERLLLAEPAIDIHIYSWGGHPHTVYYVRAADIPEALHDDFADMLRFDEIHAIYPPGIDDAVPASVWRRFLERKAAAN